MKTLIYAALIASALGLLLGGCGPVDTEPVEVARGNGCVTYRVNPGFFANYVYYTVCGRGEKVTTERTVSCGKGCTKQERTETMWDERGIGVVKP
jgi:hypothetical protein